MTMGQSLLAAILVSPLAFGGWPTITPHIAGLGTLIGLLGAVGFLLLVHGLRRLPVSVFAVLDYTALIWAGLLGFIFFAEVPGPQLWIGGSLIIAACILNSRRPVEAPAAS
jgi:S-adenosylmethionine uptake transporter